jgi:glutamate-5-semialdehyde dehydrogenase
MDNLITQLSKAKTASYHLSAMDDATRQTILLSLANAINDAQDQIIKENAKDLASMSKEDPSYDRLLLTKDRIKAMSADVAKVAVMESPLDQVLEENTLANGLMLQKISVPLGVIAVIYESRPNVTIDVFTLCFKAGNACVLKGGKEAQHSNQALVDIIHHVLAQHHISTDCVCLLPVDRKATEMVLQAREYIDVCIPRGSQALIDFVRQNAKVPTIETGAGVVHTYFDDSADLKKGTRIIENAKTRRVSVCNALDTLIVHQNRLSDLKKMVEPLAVKKVEIFADEKSHHALSTHYPHALLHKASDQDFGREFLSLKMAIKTVSSVEEAVLFILKHSSGHSEAIIAENQKTIDFFLKNVDAAAVYANTSTAFTDGGEFGMGAEIGISTQKLHARGPMGLNALTSYKWLIYGDGQTRA